MALHIGISEDKYTGPNAHLIAVDGKLMIVLYSQKLKVYYIPNNK